MFIDSDHPYHELHACERCGILSAQAHDYINRHGDIEQLCGTCYHAALNPVESTRREMNIAIRVALVIVLLASVFGCTPAPVRIQGSGVEAPPPVGYIVWCSENPGDPMCGARK